MKPAWLIFNIFNIILFIKVGCTKIL